MNAGTEEAGWRPERRGRSNLITVAVVGGLVLMLGAGGGAVAATQIGSSGIADNSIRSRDVRNGTLLAQDFSTTTKGALRGPAGPQGVTQIAALVGPVPSIVGNSGNYVFTGPPAQVTTTTALTRVTGSAAGSMGLNVGTPQFADVGMCFQPSSGGTITNFFGSNFATHYFTTARATYAVAATTALTPGTYNVGMCVRNNGSGTINNNGVVNGWVMVTS